MSRGQVSYWSRWPALPTGAGLLALVALPLWVVCTLRAKDATQAIFTDVGLQVDWVNETSRNVVLMVAIVTPIVALAVLANILVGCIWQRRGAQAGKGTYPKLLAGAVIVIDWLLLLLMALTLSIMVTWLWDMTQVNYALGGDPVLPTADNGDLTAGQPLGVWPLPDFGAKTHRVVLHLLPALVGIVSVFCAVSWLLMSQVATWVRAQCVEAQLAAEAQASGMHTPLLHPTVAVV